MNELIRMNAETYADHWANEAVWLNSQNLYAKLAEISPNENERVLEIGCGQSN